ncbi:DUF1960-domain-containing protein [Boletus edulis BED1]|uniref:DUF1960-domain-containing protein n=1 Tax=Boletus edulis BED1 TaxID=1328754 RepID=A0AAD4GL73_BOLED|nr:DUF1960-domain-containing protein [Boletus edulis BED1]
MSKSVTKVVYKPDTQSTDEFMIIVRPVEYKKWKSGEIVDSQGYLGRPSKQQLENTFGTSNDVEVVQAMLEKGKEQSSGGFHSGTFSMNTTRGSASLDNRGKGLSGI